MRFCVRMCQMGMPTHIFTFYYRSLIFTSRSRIYEISFSILLSFWCGNHYICIDFAGSIWKRYLKVEQYYLLNAQFLARKQTIYKHLFLLKPTSDSARFSVHRDLALSSDEFLLNFFIFYKS